MGLDGIGSPGGRGYRAPYGANNERSGNSERSDNGERNDYSERSDNSERSDTCVNAFNNFDKSSHFLHLLKMFDKSVKV